jgi:divalent metal cation (Fe/Co/Zn/Cd) transporter
VIVYRWFDIISDQTDKMVGKSAGDEFIEDLENIAKKHDNRIAVDRTIAYAFGAKFAVEMDIVLPRILSFEEAHDIGVALQQEFERMDDIARATVHVSF